MARMPLATEAMHEAAFQIFPPTVSWDGNEIVISPPRGAIVTIGEQEFAQAIRITSDKRDVTYQICRDGICEMPRVLQSPKNPA
jgi:hypothetical protein